MATLLKEKRSELQAKQDALHAVFAAAKTESGELDLDQVKSLGDGLSTTAKAEKIREMNNELNALGIEVQSLEEAEKALKAAGDREQKRTPMRHPGGDGDDPFKQGRQAKSFGRHFVESEAYKARGKSATIDVEVKTLFETGAGWDPEVTRTRGPIEAALRPIQVTDLIPMGTTGQAAIKYMEETTAANAAAEAAEGGQYAESALALTEKTSAVQKIATFLPVTDEQLEDVAQAEGYIDRRLRFFLRQRLDLQILVGDGISPNLRGLLSVVGIQSQAKGADPIADAVYKAMTLVRVTGRAVPGAVIFHPTNWQDVRLLRTVDGIYIWGNPSEAGPERIWGLPVAQSDAITLGKSLVGDYANFTEVAIRRGIEVKISDSHSDYFIKGKQAIRADMRAALIVYRPAALCEVTGL